MNILNTIFKRVDFHKIDSFGSYGVILLTLTASGVTQLVSFLTSEVSKVAITIAVNKKFTFRLQTTIVLR